MDLREVHQGVHRRKSRKRVGRGPGSGYGRTAAKGEKGQKSRAGKPNHPLFEGGQMPIARRLPKRGFNNKWAKTFAVVNVSALCERFDDGATVGPEELRESGLAKGRYDGIKILGDGEVTKKLTVKAHKFSRSAQEKISAAGGSIEVIQRG